jgi:urease accessory protein
MTENENVFLLLQLADSAFPVGGFAYSSGLESAVKQGFILSLEDLRNYLITFATQVISFDFPFICSSHDFHIRADEENEVSILQASYRAMLLNPPLHKVTCITGSNWIKIMKQLVLNERMTTLDNMLASKKTGYEFPVVFGLSMKAAAFTLQQTLYLFFYMSLRDQASAMIRLSVTGPFMAHKEFKSVLDLFTTRIKNFKKIPYTQSVKSAYLLELAQLSHDRVYSKLFQN